MYVYYHLPALECSNCWIVVVKYTYEHDLVYNGGKSVCVRFRPKGMILLLLTFTWLTVICCTCMLLLICKFWNISNSGRWKVRLLIASHSERLIK